MDWERREDGELKLVVLRDVEIAVAEGEALALRIEYAEVQEQLSGEMPLSAKQLVMTLDAAEALGRQLLEQAQMARATEGKA
nr:hypothetical protein [uncultured Brevundimonas sp.]